MTKMLSSNFNQHSYLPYFAKKTERMMGFYFKKICAIEIPGKHYYSYKEGDKNAFYEMYIYAPGVQKMIPAPSTAVWIPRIQRSSWKYLSTRRIPSTPPRMMKLRKPQMMCSINLQT